MGFLDKMKTMMGRSDDGDWDDGYSEPIYDDDGRVVVHRRGGDMDGFENGNRGYSRNGYGKPGAGGLSYDDGYDYDNPARTPNNPYGHPEDYDKGNGNQGSRFEQAYTSSRGDFSGPSGGIPYRDTSSGDSVHIIGNDSDETEDADEDHPVQRLPFDDASPSPKHKEDAQPGNQSVPLGVARRAPGRVVPSSAKSAAKPATKVSSGEMRIVRAVRYEDIEVISRYFRAGDTVTLVLSGARIDTAKRILDFSFGVTSALDGNVERLANLVFVLSHEPGGATEEERKILRDQGYIS